MYEILRSILFTLPPEQAHDFTIGLLSKFPFLIQSARIPEISLENKTNDKNNRQIFGLNFPNPIGLAAGLDKNAIALEAWKKMGFGFVEVGTVTPKPQIGNPKPRLFRLKADHALINRMGFNNEGMDSMKKRLESRPANFIVGVNIGKNKDTPNSDAVNDYLKCFKTLHSECDYITLNISSPNTPGLRDLQQKDLLLKMLSEIQNANQASKLQKPLFVKVAPDLNETDVEDISYCVRMAQFDAVIATNTTILRDNLITPKERIADMGSGGLSGKPVNNISTDILKLFRKHDTAVIGVGGVFSGEDAVVKINAGALLIQIYTGLIYRGPKLITECLYAIQERYPIK